MRRLLLLSLLPFMLRPYQVAPELLQDRPLTWDWQGTLPLASGKPDKVLGGYLRDMRAGEYLAAYLAAKKDIARQPEHLVDTWVMAESARKRKAVDEIMRDSESLLASSRNTATLILRVRALGLAAAKARNDNDMHAYGEVSRAQGPLLKELEISASSELPALVVEMSYNAASISAARTAAKDFAAKHPSELEYQLLVPRTLIRGDYGYPVNSGQSKLGRAVPGPTPPRYEDALSQLNSLEKRLGKHPLIDYYRAVAFATKAEIGNPDREDIGKAKQEAIRWSRAFINEGANYPRLVPLCRKCATDVYIGYFFPAKDE
jgi:hypothetical protein